MSHYSNQYEDYYESMRELQRSWNTQKELEQQKQHYEAMRHQADHNDTLPILQQRIIQLESQVSVLMSAITTLNTALFGMSKGPMYDNEWDKS